MDHPSPVEQTEPVNKNVGVEAERPALDFLSIGADSLGGNQGRSTLSLDDGLVLFDSTKEKPASGDSTTISEKSDKTEKAAEPNRKDFDGKQVDAAISSAEKSGQLMVMEFGASWCGSCKAMDKNVWPDEGVQSKLDNAVFVKADVSTDRELAERFGAGTLPVTIVGFAEKCADGKPVFVETGRIEGMKNSTDLAEGLEKQQKLARIIERQFDGEKVDEAFASALASDKLVAMEFGADWCASCKKMDREVWNDPDLRIELDKQAEFVKADVTKDTSIADRFGVKSFPTTLIGKVVKGPDGKPTFEETGRISDAKNLDEMKKELSSFYKK